MIDRRTLLLTGAGRGWLVVLGAAGAAAFGYGLATEATRAWSAMLTSGFYFLTLALGAAVFLAVMYVANAGWSAVLKRVPEALTTYVPVGGLALLATLFGAHALYHWTHEDAVAKDAVLQAKAAYLNLPFFGARMAFFLALWTGFAYLLRRFSRRQDADGEVRYTHRNRVVSAVFLLVFAYSFSAASFDWLMSIEPHWSSTIFGFYNLGGVLVAGVAAIAVATVALRRLGLLPGVNENHLHDLGKLLFAFATFWAYLWLSQYLLIWYANLPEEIAHMRARTEGGWGFLFWLNPVLGFVLPFLALLPRGAKRQDTHLLWVSGFVLAGRWLDVHLMVGPATMPRHAGIGLVEVGVFAGLCALFLWTVARGLRAAPLVARGDPYLGEALRLHQ